MKFKIKNFQEIDFSNIDPNCDEFQLPNGEMFRLADNICHVCWDGGTVLENISQNSYYCLRCRNILNWILIDLKLPKEEESKQESFLLPKDWDEENINQWKSEFIDVRRDQILVRESMLKANEGGDYI